MNQRWYEPADYCAQWGDCGLCQRSVEAAQGACTCPCHATVNANDTGAQPTMSNDSNEQGNDAAGSAFQVGDRVRYRRWNSETHEGEVTHIDVFGLATITDDRDNDHIASVDHLTLISRATPAPSEPAATPAPAAMADAVDTHPLELPVEMQCTYCNGSGIDPNIEDQGYHETECGMCGGTRYHTQTIRLSDDALDRLAGELAARMRAHDGERVGGCHVCQQYRTRAECRQVERDETCVYICLMCGNTIDESGEVI